MVARPRRFVGEQTTQLVGEAPRVGGVLTDAHRGAGAREGLGVARLVVTGRVRKRHEHGRPPNDGEL